MVGGETGQVPIVVPSLQRVGGGGRREREVEGRGRRRRRERGGKN